MSKGPQRFRKKPVVIEVVTPRVAPWWSADSTFASSRPPTTSWR